MVRPSRNEMNPDTYAVIRKAYPKLSRSAKQVADYVLVNASDALYLSITSLAEACGVSEATISRFCQRLGYNSFSEFKLSLAMSRDDSQKARIEERMSFEPKSVDYISFSTEVRESYRTALEVAALQLTESSLEAAVDLIDDAKRVFCFGQGGNTVIAQEAQIIFMPATPKFIWIHDTHMQAMTAAQLEEDDVILFFSYSGATRDVVDTLEAARESKGKVILVTHFAQSPGAALADVVLLCGTQESPLQVGAVATKIAMLYIIDLMFRVYCSRHVEASQEAIRKSARAAARKSL